MMEVILLFETMLLAAVTMADLWLVLKVLDRAWRLHLARKLQQQQRESRYMTRGW